MPRVCRRDASGRLRAGFVGRALEASPLAIPRSARSSGHAGGAQTQEVTDLLSPFEQALTRAEELFDALDHSAIAEVIPFAGRVVKLWRAGRRGRDYLFAAKLLSFITDPSLQTPEARKRMRERAESDEAKKIGEALFLILERLSDMQKPTWLAKVYAAYLAGELKASDMRRLASAIDMAFGDDLIELIKSPAEMSPADAEPWKKNLTASGLMNVERLPTLGAAPPQYHVSEWGRMLRKAVRDHT